MIKFVALLSFPLAIKSQQDHTPINLRHGAVKVLSKLLPANTVDDLTSHGCWCSRLDHTKDDIANPTGGQPIDELDKICKDWFSSRTCLNLEYGSCETGNVEKFYDSTNCDTINNACMSDICLVDEFYSHLIHEHIDTNPTYQKNTICVHNPATPKHRWCEGTAPHLEIKHDNVLKSVDGEHYGHGLADSKIHKVCQDKLMNLVFVIDGSEDTGIDDFIMIKNYLISLFFELDIEPGKTQVTVIQYGGHAQIISRNANVENLQQETALMHRINGPPNIGEGLLTAVSAMASNFISSTMENVVVVFSMGETSDDVTVPLTLVDMMADVYFVNMGIRNNEVTESFEAVIGKEFVYQAKSDEILHLQEKLSTDACSQIL